VLFLYQHSYLLWLELQEFSSWAGRQAGLGQQVRQQLWQLLCLVCQVRWLGLRLGPAMATVMGAASPAVPFPVSVWVWDHH